MSWIQTLCKTADSIYPLNTENESRPWPVSHIVKKAHVEVVLSSDGSFRRARKLERHESPTLIPATEASAGRTAGDDPHPLCEELSYCASDLPESNGNRFNKYTDLMRAWVESEHSHPKAKAVLAFLEKGVLWETLRKQAIIPLKMEDSKGRKVPIEDRKIFVRWKIEEAEELCSGTWEDEALIQAWMQFDRSQNLQQGFCMVTGEAIRIAKNHSRFVRSSDDGGKIISSNDFEGYTFRGRFTDTKKDYGKQACSVGYEASQLAHGTLRWLISRQGYRNDDQVFVAWAVTGQKIPDPWKDSYALFEDAEISSGPDNTQPALYAGDVGQSFAFRFNQALAGYKANLSDNADIVVMGLDSATPGRMAITYYRELKGSEFLERIQAWHEKGAWPQNFGKDSKFVGVPSPRDIAEAAYGRRLDDKLRKATVERLIPCIVDGLPISRDLVESCVRRAFNRVGLEGWEWEKCLGIACSLYKGFYWTRRYQMTLEEGRKTRDYLYGCLLAIAENIESLALYLAGENRSTTAARLMQRFAERPYSTWKNIELALTPYKSRLRSSRGAFLYRMEQLLDKVICAFPADGQEAFINDRALSGEFLLGYHCQRRKLREKPEDTETDPEKESN